MVLVRARLHRHIEVAAAGLAELRCIVAGLNRYFLNRVDAGLGNLGLLFPDTIGGVLTFDANRLGIGRQPVNPDHDVTCERRARNQVEDLQGISNVAAERQHWKIVGTVGTDDMANVGALGLEQGGRIRDGHGFCIGGYLK